MQRGLGASCGQARCKPAEAVVLQHGRDGARVEGSRQAQQHPRGRLRASLLPALGPKRCGLPLQHLLHTTEGDAPLPSPCSVRDSGLVWLAQDACASRCLGSQTEHLLGKCGRVWIYMQVLPSPWYGQSQAGAKAFLFVCPSRAGSPTRQLTPAVLPPVVFSSVTPFLTSGLCRIPGDPSDPRGCTLGVSRADTTSPTAQHF